VVKRLLDTGVSLQNIRTAVDHLRARGVADLAQITLLSDGTTVYECTSAEEVVDLLAGGRACRHRGLRRAARADRLAGELPSERAEAAATEPAEVARPARRAHPAPGRRQSAAAEPQAGAPAAFGGRGLLFALPAYR